MNGGFLYAIAAGVFAGIALALLLSLGLMSALVCLVAAAAALLLALMIRKPLLIVVSIALIGCALGLVRTSLFLSHESAQTLPLVVGQTTQVEGIVAADPDRRETSLHITLVVRAIHGASQSGTLLVLLPREAQVSYNDRVVVSGSIVAPQSFLTQSGKEFDYPNYLRVQGISAVMERATLVSDKPSGFTISGILFELKHSFEDSINRNLPEPEASLLNGILLGDRGGFPQALITAFAIVGLIHVVVLSGSNVSIVSEAVFRVFSFLPRRASLVLGTTAVVLFAVMTGGAAATVRATIMGFVAIFARYFHRTSIALRALALAAACMALWNPLVLLYDSGFILSVLATFGLITLSPMIEAKLTMIPAWNNFNIRSIIATTAGVELFILPALLYFSGLFSLLSLPVNALVLPLVPAVMFLGFITGVLGFIHPLLAYLPALITQLLLKIMIIITTTAASWPFASINLANVPAWMVVVCYVPLTAFAIWIYQRSATQRSAN